MTQFQKVKDLLLHIRHLFHADELPQRCIKNVTNIKYLAIPIVLPSICYVSFYQVRIYRYFFVKPHNINEFLLNCTRQSTCVMKIRLLMICIAGIVMRNPALAQPAIEKHEEIMESLAESIENLASSQSDYESVLEDLEYLFNHPLNVNTASYADLQKLPFLTDFQIQSLLRYREENGIQTAVLEVVGGLFGSQLFGFAEVFNLESVGFEDLHGVFGRARSHRPNGHILALQIGWRLDVGILARH